MKTKWFYPSIAEDEFMRKERKQLRKLAVRTACRIKAACEENIHDRFMVFMPLLASRSERSAVEAEFIDELMDYAKSLPGVDIEKMDGHCCMIEVSKRA